MRLSIQLHTPIRRNKEMRRPIQISYKKGVFEIKAHLLVLGRGLSQEKRAYYTRLIKEGIADRWTVSFVVNSQMIPVLERFLERNNPQALKEFRNDLEEIISSLENSSVEAVPKMKFELFFSEENFTGWFPLWRFFRRVVEGGRRPLIIYLKELKAFPAHVKSSFFRRGWGFFKDFNVISMGFNWHPLYPGLIFLPYRRTEASFRRVAAHEFGHTMGLSDAYDAWYRGYDEYPGSKSFLMNANGYLQQEEVLRMFEAQASHRLSHFPFKLKPEVFFKGLHEDLKRTARKLFSRSQR